MQMAILTDFKLDCDPKLCNTKSGKDSYYVFFASSVLPDKNGIYFKISCQAWGHIAEKVKAMKLHAGSVVNITANMSAYEKDGKPQTSYSIIDINFAAFLGGQDKATENKQNSNEKKASKSLLEQLATSPFK